jgi:hypothetical protein
LFRADTKVDVAHELQRATKPFTTCFVDPPSEIIPRVRLDHLPNNRAVGAGLFMNVHESSACERSFEVVDERKPFLPWEDSVKGLTCPLFVGERCRYLRPEPAGGIRFRARQA